MTNANSESKRPGYSPSCNGMDLFSHFHSTKDHSSLALMNADGNGTNGPKANRTEKR